MPVQAGKIHIRHWLKDSFRVIIKANRIRSLEEPMTRIYLIRHAEAEGNLYRIAQGQYNSILTDRGWRQVEALRRRFAAIPSDAG